MEENQVIDPSEGLYHSRIFASYVRFLRKAYRHVDIGDILRYAGIETHQLEDEDYWFTQKQADRFNERAVKVTGNNDLAGDAARLSLSADSIGFVKSYILGHVTIGRAFENCARISSRFVRSAVYESTKLAPNKVRIIVTPRPGVQEKPYQCQGRIGFLEALSALFYRESPRLEHTRCLFNGDGYCEHMLTWDEPKHEFWRKARVLGGGALLAAAAGLFFRSTTAGLAGVAILLAGLAFFSSRVGKLERHELRLAMENLSRSTVDAIEKMEVSDNNARMTQEIGHILTRQETVTGLLNEVTRILEKRLDYDWGAIIIKDKNKGILEMRNMFGYSRQVLARLNNGVLRSDGPATLTAKCFQEQTPFMVNDVNEPPAGLASHLGIAKRLGIASLLCCPIVCADEPMGVLAVGNTKTKRLLQQNDMDLLVLVGQEVGVRIQNLVLKQTEKALRESEALFRAVVEKSSEVLVLTNGKGSIFYVSPRATEGFGYKPSELMGTGWIGLVHSEDLRAFGEARSRVHENPGIATNVTVRMRHRDGTWRWVEITIRDLLAEPGVGAVVSNLRDITDRMEVQQALEESENKFRALVEKAMVGVYLIQAGVFQYVNAKCADIHGYGDPQMMQGLDVRTTILPEDIFPPERTDEWVRGEDESHRRQFRIVRKDGKVRYVETFGRYTTYRGEPAVIGMIIDVTDRKNAEVALRWKTTFLEALVDSSHDGILILDSRKQKVLQNERFVKLWKMPRDIARTEDEEQRIKFFMKSIKDPREFYGKLMHLYNHPDDIVNAEFELVDGTIVDIFSYPVTGKDADSQYGRIWTFRDITEVRHYWDMLEGLSTTDGLTGIANRRRFDGFLDQEWNRSMRDQTELSLILMDVDYFKQFNDQYGHLAGDDCLKQIAAVLKKSVRRAGDLVARYGGEEFACVLPGTGRRRAWEIAHRIAHEMAELEIPHGDSPVAGVVTLSFGVATMVPKRGQEYPDLIGMADRSLYSAKERGRNRVAALDDDRNIETEKDEQRNSA